jgi:hypothetical protein
MRFWAKNRAGRVGLVAVLGLIAVQAAGNWVVALGHIVHARRHCRCLFKILVAYL